MRRITVITPCFQSAKTIETTLRSVAMQREDGLEVEHIIMDGGSTDETAGIVARHAHPDTRFFSEPDDGPADAINRGMRHATGTYACWLNADDYYAPQALRRATAALDANPGRAFCFGHCRIVDGSGVEIRRFITGFKAFWFPLSCRFMIRTLNYISQPAMVFRRSAFEAAGPLRTDLTAAWDYDLTLRLWAQGGGLRVGPPELAYFRWTPDSISGRGFRTQFAEELDCVRRDAGACACSSLLHWFVSRGIVFCYTRMAGNRSAT